MYPTIWSEEDDGFSSDGLRNDDAELSTDDAVVLMEALRSDDAELTDNSTDPSELG